MTRLTLVEMRRLCARRLTRVAAVAVLLLVGISLYGTQQLVWNATPERVAQVQQESLQSCIDAQNDARQSDPTADFGCSQIVDPVQTQLMSLSFVDVARTSVTALAYLLAFIGFVVGATFVAAELATGSMGMWLTYEPRRLRVYASKLVALLAGVLAVATLALGLAMAATLALTRHYGLEDGSAQAGGGQLGGDLLRTLGLVGVAGLVGAAVGILLRHTAAALGLLIGYLVVVELLLGRGLGYLVGEPRPWLLLSNVEAWLQAGLLSDTSPACYDPSQPCPSPGELISTAHAGTYLALLTVVVVVLGAVIFRRRDVG